MKQETKKNTTDLLKSLKEGMSSLIQFHISENMVTQFANLTGDHSSLHTNESFARRSMYRQKIVHGMLPFGFISILDLFHINGLICVLKELSAKFIEPIFIDDKLSLFAEVIEIKNEDAQVTSSYFIKNEKTGTIVTKGIIIADYVDATKIRNGIGQPVAINNCVKMPTESLTEQNLQLEEISKNDTDSFSFIVSQKSILSFIQMVREGISGKEHIDIHGLTKRFVFSNLLATMLFSTSAGMRIPGKYATFLEFATKFAIPLETETSYSLKGEIVHVSRSTRIIKKNIFIYSDKHPEDVITTGRITIYINEAPTKMPTTRYLKESALDCCLKDKVVLITGASRGIGATTARLFALSGSKVVVNYFRGDEDARRIVKGITKEGGDAIAVQADVSNPVQVRKMIQRAVKEYGTIHTLVNNAVRDFRPKSFLDLSWEDMQKDINVVVKGAFNCCKEVIPLMLEQGEGKIINIGTVATDNPPPNQVKYVISKSGLVGLTRSLSIEFAAKNIQVNMVVPNFVETDLVSHIPDVYKKKIAQDTPMKRNASPIDVAQAIIFLASSYASFTTGQKIMVTGGGAPYL